MEYMTQKQILLMDFEEKVITIIQEFLHYKERKPTMKELEESVGIDLDDEYSNGRDYVNIMMDCLRG